MSDWEYRGARLAGLRPTAPPSKRLLILGSTGSIGTQALDVLARSEEIELVGLSAERSWEALVKQARTHRVGRIALVDEQAARAAIDAWPEGEVLSGAEARPLALLEATLGEAMHEKAGLTHFLPARIEWVAGRAEVKALAWRGSGDIGALSKANCFLVVPEDRQEIAVGERVTVLVRGDVV